jgi:glycosyltransferase 2 family protein
VHALKLLWLLAAFAAAVVYLWRERQVLGAVQVALVTTEALGALLAMLIAKGLLARNAQLAAARYGAVAPYRFFLHSYNLSQLGKYLPGSVWQFVGRYGLYRAVDFRPAAIRDALITETAWVLLGAALASLLLLAQPFALADVFGRIPGGALWLLAAGVGGLLVPRVRRLVGSLVVRYRPTRAALLGQGVIWIFLGGAYVGLSQALGVEGFDAVFATGLFASAYAIGFLVPFAPAGVGVREGILVAGSLPFMPVDAAVTLALLARILYLLVDLGLALCSAVVTYPAGRAGDPG